MLASDPNPVEYLSWWSAIIGTLLAGIGTLSALVMLWWAWEQRRDARQATRSSRRHPGKKKRKVRPDGVVAGSSVPTEGGITQSWVRRTARRAMPTISVVLAIAFVALLGGLFTFARLMRETSYGQLVVVRGDVPTGRTTNPCESGLCPVTDHWSLTGDARHVTFGYVGLERPRAQHGKAVVGVAAPGCDAGPQVRWQVLIDGQPVASGTAGAVKSGKVLDVATDQTITMVVDRTSTTACAVDLQVTSMVFFAPDQVWKLMEDQGIRLEP